MLSDEDLAWVVVLVLTQWLPMILGAVFLAAVLMKRTTSGFRLGVFVGSCVGVVLLWLRRFLNVVTDLESFDMAELLFILVIMPAGMACYGAFFGGMFALLIRWVKASARAFTASNR